MEPVKGANNLLKAFLSISVAAIIIGALFKIMHWPFANAAMLIGYIGVALTFPKMTLSNPKRKTDDIVQALAIFVFGASKALYILLNMDKGGHSRNFQFLNLLGFIGLIVFLIFKLKVFTQPRAGRENKNPLIVIALFYLGATALSVGLLFKYLHWPGASILLISGAICGLLWYLSDIFYPDEDDKKDDDEILF